LCNYNVFQFDQKIRKSFNVNLIAGVDEAGRGCICGPLVAAAVVFDENVYIPFLKESKSLSSTQRIHFFKQILSSAKSLAYHIVSVEEINKFGLSKANYLAMKYAVDKLNIKPELVIVDGFYNPYIDKIKQYSLVKADKESAVVAAASIVAKVIRDTIMKIYHYIVPEYDLLNNKGYPTRKHISVISKIGLCELHRCYAYKFVKNNE